MLMESFDRFDSRSNSCTSVESFRELKFSYKYACDQFPLQRLLAEFLLPSMALLDSDGMEEGSRKWFEV